jgi:Protein of unknown function (DUF3298).
MKPGKYFKTAMLLGLISMSVMIGNINSKEVPQASAADRGIQTVSSVTGQAITVTTTDLYPVGIEVNGETKFGYIDGSGQMVIQPNYTSAGNFSDGLAVVYNGKKYQVINQKGEVTFETDAMVTEYHNGLASFTDLKNYKNGYMDTKGNVVIKAKYGFAGNFQADHTAYVTDNGKIHKINSTGKVLKTYQLKGKYNYYDVTEDGLIICNNPSNFRMGVVNLEGKVIIKPIYGEITYLGNHRFGVKEASADSESYLIGIKPSAIFNQSGKRLTSYQYYDLSAFSGDYASATDNKYTYLIDKSGNKMSTWPMLEGRGTIKVLGDVLQADIDNERFYVAKDGTLLWKNDNTTILPSKITVTAIKIRQNKFVVVNYPELSGMSDIKVQDSINEKLKTLFTKNRMSIKEKDYLTVDDSFTVQQIGDLLIIQKTGYDYPIGAAHGQPLRIYYFVNVNTGDFYQLKDLFKKDSDYVKKLSNIVSKQMKQANDNVFSYFDNKVTISKDQYFYLSKNKLTIYFDCAEITAYAAGFPEFEIPFKDIKSIIDTEGSFWKSLQN